MDKLESLSASFKSFRVNDTLSYLPDGATEKLQLVFASFKSAASYIPQDALETIYSLKDTVDALAFQDAVVAVVTVALGVYYIFKRFEPNGIYTLPFLLIAVPALLTPLLLPHYSSALQGLAVTFATYLSTIAGATVAYRLSPFHPLANVPGPLINKVSKWWMVHISSQGKMHLYYQDLHAKYGDIVRIGPNEVSINDVASITPLIGAQGWPKGPNWDGRIPSQTTKSLIAINDAKEHARRRQFWNRGFNSSALKDYEPVIERRTTQLANQLEKQTNPLDLSRWLSYFTYDFMSDMVFSGGTDMLNDHDKDGLWGMLDAGQQTSLFLGHVPWLAGIYMRLPGAGADLMKHMMMARGRAFNRAKNGSVTKDLYYYLNDEGGFEPTRPTMAQVVNDGGLATIAGADTTSVTLAHLFWFLLRNPQAYARLQAEVDKFFPPGESPFNAAQHAQLHYLNAVINETLRLLPPLMSGSQRAAEKGQGGKVLAGHFLPEGTKAFIHTYSVQRDPRNFSPLPEEFVPERWLPADQPGSYLAPDFKGEVHHNTAAFIPFSFGPAVCVGKNLAYQEMRMTISSLLQRFDFRFADGFRPETWEENLLDLFVTMRGPLPVVVSPRKGVVVN